MSGGRWWLWLALAGLWACDSSQDLTAIGVNLPPPQLRPSPSQDGGASLLPWPTAIDQGAGPALPWPVEDDRPHPLERAPLPAAWPARDFSVAGVDFSRWVVGDDVVVGLGVLESGAPLALTATGGLFSDWSLEGWRPLPTPLPPLARAHVEGDLVLACPSARTPARLSLDGGQHWAQLDLRCGDGAEVTLDQGRIFHLKADQLEIWDVLTGQRRARALPLPDPVAVGADGSRVVVFGTDSAFWSADGGRTFAPADVPDEIPRVKTVLGGHKHVMLALGEGQNGGTPLLLSRDDGRHWSPPTALPRAARHLWAGAMDQNRVFVATPRTADGVVIRSEDIGRTWRAVVSPRPMFGAAAGRPLGVLTGVRGGLVRAVDGPQIRPLDLDQPLRAVRFTHPLIGVAVGALSGVYCTRDGGVRWTLCSPELQLPFTVLDKADDHTYFVGGAGVLRRTRDAGRTWTTVTLASPCRPRWIRFHGAVGIMACGEERYLLTDDAGRTWVEAADAPAAMSPPVWLDDRRLVTLGERVFRVSDDGGWSWRTTDAPRPDLVDLRRLGTELSAVTAGGVVGRADSVDGPWSWRFPSEDETSSAPIIAHRPLDDGRVVLLDRDHVYLWDGARTKVAVGDVPDAHEIALVGDGSVLVLQTGATTRFEGR